MSKLTKGKLDKREWWMDDRAVIWPWFDGNHKVHCFTKEMQVEIARWEGTIKHGRDAIIPTKHLRRAMAILRQYHGQKNPQNAAVERQ